VFVTLYQLLYRVLIRNISDLRTDLVRFTALVYILPYTEHYFPRITVIALL